LMTTKSALDNKPISWKYRRTKGFSKKDRLTFDRTKEIYKDNMLLMNKLNEIKLRSNSVDSHRAKSASASKKRRHRGKTQNNFYSDGQNGDQNLIDVSDSNNLTSSQILNNKRPQTQEASDQIKVLEESREMKAIDENQLIGIF
jgi:hypothetical protein